MRNEAKLQPPGTPLEFWERWREMTMMNIWRGTISMGGDPFGFITGLVKVMENIQERVYTGQPLPGDPFELFQEWYNATNKSWSSMVEDNIASERFLAFTGPGLENYAYLVRTFRHASEAYFKALQLPTRSDISRVAEMVVDLEEKVDTIEESIEHLKEQQPPQSAATITRIANMEQRLNQIEAKLERMLTLLEKLNAGTADGPATSLP